MPEPQSALQRALARARSPEAGKPAARDRSARRPLDLVLAFDTTGSMYRYLEEVRRELGRLAAALREAVPETRFGVVAFGDYCDSATTYVTKVLDLTDDVVIVRQFVATVEATGGGDMPEAVEEALHRARHVSWRAGANRALVLVGDAPPHGVIDARGPHDHVVETRALAQFGVRIYSVQCGNEQSTTTVFRWLARETNGVYLELSNIQDLVDLIVGICLREAGLLTGFVDRLRAEHRLTESKERILKQLEGER